MYVFGYSGNFDLGNFSDEFNTFKLSTITIDDTYIDLYDATGLPESSLPFSLPSTESKTYTGNADIAIPSSFSSNNLIDIDSISLKNTFIKLSADCEGISAGSENLSITLTAVGNGADYYDVNGIKQNSWVLHLGETKIV